MAKRERAKKLPIVAIIFGVIALLAIILPAIQKEVMGEVVGYKGIHIVFGYTEKSNFGSVEVFKFSFLALLPYLLVIAGIVLSAMGRTNNLMLFVSVAVFVVAAALFFMTKSLIVYANDIVEATLKDFDLATGATGAAGTCVICAIINLISGLKK